jgi:S1-C subfamily serine protease
MADGSSDQSNNASDSSDEANASIDLLGLTVQPVDQDAVQQFELAPDQRGLLVTRVTPGGPSYGEVADPDQGGPDIILSVEGKPLKSVADLKQALKGFKKDDIVSLRIYNTQAKTRRIQRIRLGE